MLLRYFLVRKKKIWLLISPFSSWLQTHSYSRATGQSVVAGSTLRFPAGNTKRISCGTGTQLIRLEWFFFFLIQYQTMCPFQKLKLLSIIQLYGTKSDIFIILRTHTSEMKPLLSLGTSLQRTFLVQLFYLVGFELLLRCLLWKNKQTKLLFFFPL